VKHSHATHVSDEVKALVGNLDEADKLLLNDLQSRFDAAISEFLSSPVIADERRRTAALLVSLAVRTACVEIHCDREGIDDRLRRQILAVSAGSAVSQTAGRHAHSGCDDERCEFSANLKRVERELLARYTSLEDRVRSGESPAGHQPEKPVIKMAEAAAATRRILEEFE
jgi:hypothetical protein